MHQSFSTFWFTKRLIGIIINYDWCYVFDGRFYSSKIRILCKIWSSSTLIVYLAVIGAGIFLLFFVLSNASLPDDLSSQLDGSL